MADESWLRGNVEQVLALRASLAEGLEQLGFDVVPSQANFVWCTHPRSGHESLYLGLKSQGILVRLVYDGWGDGLRISVGTQDQQAALLECSPRCWRRDANRIDR
ncbi:MAG: aminotransferase class I/II-fold pyridoxal phosphate-dependent enzyme [Pirellulaceae bacterium]